MSVVEELSGDGSRIVTSWKRTTVADGDWLQHNTIGPLNERDVFLAEKIDELSGNADEKLNEERIARENADAFLSETIDTFSGKYETFKSNVEASASTLNTKIDNEITRATNKEGELNAKITQTNTRIDNLEAATDVIAVFGTYEEFTAASASTWQQTVTDNDFIKVIRDNNYQPNTNDPDYNTTDDDVYQVYYEYHKTNHDGWIGWSAIGSLDPYYSVSEIDDKETELSSTIANTYLSANGTDISAGKNLDVVIQSNNPRVAFKTKDDVSFSNLTSTNTISTNFSGNTLSGETLYTSIDGLIESATNGGAMTGVKNVSGIKLTHIANQRDYEQNPDDGEFGFSTSADQLTFYVSGGAAEWLKPKVGGNPYGICLTGESIENYLGGKSLNVSADYAYTAATTLDTFTAKTPNNEYVGEINQLYLSAGKGIDFVSGNDGKLTISSEGTTYTTGQYINISNDNKISVTGTLINSAQSGQSAYNWITAQSATLSAGFGIQFTSAGQNTMGIKLNATLNGDDKIVSIGGKELVGGDDYIPYSAVEVRTIGTDQCVYGITSGSNVLNIAASYAYKDENGDRIDTNYVKISAMGNYVSANPYGISISSDSVVKLVFTPTLPSTLDNNTYYIV